MFSKQSATPQFLVSPTCQFVLTTAYPFSTTEKRGRVFLASVEFFRYRSRLPASENTRTKNHRVERTRIRALTETARTPRVRATGRVLSARVAKIHVLIRLFIGPRSRRSLQAPPIDRWPEIVRHAIPKLYPDTWRPRATRHRL